MLIDSHCHLDAQEFASDLEAVIKRAGDAGVGRMIAIACNEGDFEPTRAIAEKFPGVYYTFGVQPDEAAIPSRQLTSKQLAEYSKYPKLVGLGECGLDYHYHSSTKEEQEKLFRSHIAASLETGLPLVIHTRDAEEDTVRIIKEETAGQKLNAVLHCFSSKRWLAEQAIELGLYISFSGIITFKKSEDLRETVKIVPLDRILVETDAPFLAPEPYRGKRNEPAFVVHTASKLAEIKGVTNDEIASHTTENCLRLFGRISEEGLSL